jgi:hypothetical protein
MKDPIALRGVATDVTFQVICDSYICSEERLESLASALAHLVESTCRNQHISPEINTRTIIRRKREHETWEQDKTEVHNICCPGIKYTTSTYAELSFQKQT